MSDYIYTNDTSVVLLDCTDAFNELTEKEKLYAHYLSRASWYGGLIDLVQTSLESPLIFILLHKLFRTESLDDLKNTALNECGFTEDEFVAFLIYACGIFSNIGNYKGFGDTKFIPNLGKDKFEKLVLSSKFAKACPQEVKSLLCRCLEPIFSLEDKDCRLSFPFKGTTTYLSKNITEEDIEEVNKFLKQKKVEGWNSRLFKIVDETGKNHFEIRLASVLDTKDEEDKELLCTDNLNGHNFVITRGDYSKLLELVNENLLLAKEHAANDNEEKMIENYIHSFRTGSIDAHKEGSRFWIKDRGPVIESYIGFLETYRDPVGMRGEFRGFVAIVNKAMSDRFTKLVNSAHNLLLRLPWSRAFEKDQFLRPDFTSLDVLTFANSRVPAGICIPNYNEIRQNEGFKNVSLGNTLSVETKEPPNYLNESDQELLLKYGNKAFEFTVGLHELLGHGSGKLFRREKNGTFNFNILEDVNFLTQEKITSWYEDGETYGSVFGSIGSSYEECRAECVALYLCDETEALRIFGYEGQEASDIIYSLWLSMVLSGLHGLAMYDPKTKSWLQAHSQARFVILQVLLESGGDLVKIEKVDGKDGNPYLLLSLDRTAITTVGKNIIKVFLQKLQVYRSTADVSAAKKMYNKYSDVSSENRYPFLEFREIIVRRKKPRRIFVQSNTFCENDKVSLRNYESTIEGMIESWVDRLQDEKIDGILEELWGKDKPYFS